MLSPQLIAAQTKRALLIGIDSYTPEKLFPTDGRPHRPDSRFSGEVQWQNLEGPDNDVKSIAAVLPQFGFTEIKQLLNNEATRQGILEAVDKYIVREAKANDTVLFYFAGHGSQRFNSKSKKLDHLDETIVPSDAYKGAFDIRDKELAREFNKAIDRGAHVIAIFDSCHSGTMARGPKVGVSRWLPYDDRDAEDPGDYGDASKRQSNPPAKRGAIVISAALSNQSAEEVFDSKDNLVHGVFTTAFIRALNSSTPAWTALDVLNSADALLKAESWTQQPTLEGEANRPLFGEFRINSIRAVVRDLIFPDQITLSVGSALGLGPGTEFTAKTEATLVKVQITELRGVASSIARLISGNLANIHAGDLFEMTKLAVPREAKLTVFVPGAVDEEDQRSLESQIAKLSGNEKWSRVQDPTLDLPSNLIYWNSDLGWVLTKPDGSTKSLGRILKTTGISESIARGAKVYISVPPTTTFLSALQRRPELSDGSIDLSDSLNTSQYMLIGRRTDQGPVEYALALPRLFGGLNSTSIVRNETAVCSSDSELPLKTDWVPVRPGSQGLSASSGEIEKAAIRLGRNRSWLTAGSHNSDHFWPYRLLVKTENSSQVQETIFSKGTRYEIDLVAETGQMSSLAITPQYVYVFGLQCDGAGSLIYPSVSLGGDAPLPLLTPEQRYPEKITLAHQMVAPPMGLDTIVLLVTSEKISDLSAFDYSGVVTHGGDRGSGWGSELTELIRGINGQSRGLAAVSANWSIQRVQIKSR